MNSATINNAYVNYKSDITRYLSHIVKQPQDAEDSDAGMLHSAHERSRRHP
nr:hypothetical protein [Paenibacillus xylanexedens]